MPARRQTLTLKETAEVLGISHWTVEDMARAGRLPGAFKLQGVWLVSKPALDAFLANPVSEPKPVG